MSSSAMSKEPIRGLISCTVASYDRRMAGRYSWMKSPNCPTRCKSSSCAFSRSKNSIPLVQGSRRERIFASSPRPTRICGKLCAAGDFARISTTGFMSSRLSFLPYASARKISPCWRIISCSISRMLSTKALKGFPPRPCSYSWSITGQAMCVSWPMWSSVRLYWRLRTSSPLTSFCLGNSHLALSSQLSCCLRKRERSSSGLILCRYLPRREETSRGRRRSPGGIGRRSIDCCENMA